MERAAPLFVDRDGTLVEEVGYLRRLEDMRLLPGAARAVRTATEAGHPVVVVSNQSGVARGLIDEAFLEAAAQRLEALLAAEGGRLLAQYYCPHHPDGHPPYNLDCPHRKPRPGMLLRAAREHGLRLEGAWMVGDRPSDLETGAGLGVRPVLVRTGYGHEAEAALPPDFAARGGLVCDDLAAAVTRLLAEENATASG